MRLAFIRETAIHTCWLFKVRGGYRGELYSSGIKTRGAGAPLPLSAYMYKFSISARTVAEASNKPLMGKSSLYICKNIELVYYGL